MNRMPAAIFIVDINKEKIAIAEAKKLNIPTFAMVDTNSDPNLVDFPIPSNDDASRSIECIVEILVNAVAEGLDERNKDAEQKAMEEIKKSNAKKEKQKKEETTKNEE
jgi:small subunit ribosomal protein S2